MSIDKLVNQQVRRWQAEAQRIHAMPAPDPMQRPMLAISRQTGAKGTQIAQKLASHLAFELYDRILVEQIAKTSKIRNVLVELVDDRVQDMISTWISETFPTDRMSPSVYLKNLSRVVMSLGNLGQGVIVGRGAHFILDPQWTLRIRIFAPTDIRIERFSQSKGIEEPQAAEIIQKKDQERQLFCKRQYAKDLTDPTHYDLVLNTEHLTEDVCVEMTLLAFRSRFPAN